MLSFNFRLPTTLLFGPGRLAELETTPFLPKGKKALIVIGQSGNILRQGYLGRVQGLLGARGVQTVVFDGVRANPRVEDVDAAAEQARRLGADFVLAIGGGSVIDSAKCLSLAASTEAPFWEAMAAGVYADRTGLPLVAVPTTAGTGTEGNAVAVLCGGPGKRGFVHPAFYPALSIVDPELTVSVPPRMTAVTGMDAFFHAVECFLSTARQPMSDMLCLDAVHLVTRFLPQAVEEPGDVNARTALAWASTAAGMCLSLSSPIAQHALEYSFSGTNPSAQHGAGLVLLSRSFFAKFIELAEDVEDARDRMYNLAVAMGFGAGEDGEAHPFLEGLEALLEASGLAELTPEEQGFGAEHLDEYVAKAMELTGSRQFQNTPVPLGEAEVREIFTGVFER